MAEFWRSSGYHLLEVREDGLLGVTDDFLRAYFKRPEMALQPESCAAERTLYEAMIDDPRRTVSDSEIAAIADPDARDNYRVLLGFRDRLIASGTVEGCYLRLFGSDSGAIAPLFLDQMVHVILRGMLDGCTDSQQVRAAELLFRTQKVSLRDGAILMADEETVELNRRTAGLGDIGRMLIEAETPLDQIQMDVLGPGNADAYWERSDRYDLVFDASFGQPGLSALCRVLEAWTAHMLGVSVAVEPVSEINDERWVWHIGLDAQANAILNDLYEGTSVDEDRMRCLLALFRLEFAEDVALRPDVTGRPVYLGLAMDSEKIMQVKPQNLLVNLPLVPKS